MASLESPTGHVASYSALPAGASDGDVYICDDNNEGFQWGSSTWNFIGTAQSGSGQTGSTPVAPSTGQAPPASSAGSDPEEPKFESGEGLEAAAKKLFWVADGLGEAKVSRGTDHSVVLLYEDGSMITVRFEWRAGTLPGLGVKAADDEDAKARNEKFSKAKEAADEVKNRPRPEPEPQPQPVNA